MFQAPFLMQQAVGGGAALAAPVMSNRLAIQKTDANIWGAVGAGTLVQAYTSGAGNVVFLGCARGTSSSNPLLLTDWSGDVMAALAGAKQDGGFSLICGASLKAAGAVGAGTFHAGATPSNNRMRHLLAWLFDLDHVRGGVGGAAAASSLVNQAFIEVSLAVQQVGSLLVAAGWNQAEDARPFTWSAGWTKMEELALGTGQEPCGSIATRISAATGPQTVRMTGDQTAAEWALAAVEFPPG